MAKRRVFTFRLESSDRDMLEQLSRDFERSKGDVLRLLIRHAAGREFPSCPLWSRLLGSQECNESGLGAWIVRREAITQSPANDELCFGPSNVSS